MDTPNQVTVFSNGIADFRRVFALQPNAQQQITLDIRKDHLADVLASLCVYGDVTFSEPPTYSPAGEHAGNLSLDPERVLEDLAVQLCGARLSIERAGGHLQGTLMGLHSEPEATSGQKVEPRYLVLMTDDGLAKVPLRELQHVRFEDSAIRREINKSLQRSVERIKPDSTQVRLTLETESDDVEALVQYTVPAAAWKITYRLRDEGRGQLALEALAVVDNNTEEDWNDFMVSVVTGEPITFATDLAEAKTPRRNHVNVVQEQALGAVEVERGAAFMGARRSVAAADTSLSEESAGGEFQDLSREYRSRPAMRADTETREVGDFSVFESRHPISIGAHRSVIFPIFETTLDDGKIVLYYKHSDHAERPFRAFRFRNPAQHALGRGVCTVFQGGIYAGSCVMPATKPGEVRLTPFALETGVRCRFERSPEKSDLVRLHLADGFCRSSHRHRWQTRYTFENSRDESLPLIVDHIRAHPDATVRCRLRRDAQPEWIDLPQDHLEVLKEGWRLEWSLQPRDLVELEVSESVMHDSRVELLQDMDLRWLRANLIQGPLAEYPGLEQCLEIRRRMDDKRRGMEMAEQQVATLDKRQERLRKNIQVAGNDEQSGRWRAELGRAEDEITRLQEQQLPQLLAECQTLEQELREQLSALSAEWQQP